MSFEEAALATRDPLSLDFDDGLQPANLVTLAASPTGRILYVVSTESSYRVRIISARDAHAKNGDGMKKQNEPSAESLDEMPEIDDQRFRRRPGRGHHAARSAGEIVTIDADLWSHFGSAEAINDALRRVVVEGKKAAGS